MFLSSLIPTVERHSPGSSLDRFPKSTRIPLPVRRISIPIALSPRVSSVLTRTEAFVEDWWASLFDVTRADLWRTTTLRRHDALGDYPGWFVAWRDDGVHVSVPAGAPDDAVAAIGAEPVHRLQDVTYWQGFASTYGGRVIGPGIHHYLDRDPGPAPGVVEVPVAEVARLRPRVTEDEWQESGMDGEDIAVAFGSYDDGELVAASTLADFAGAPRHVGVLVAPAVRGRGLVDDVGAAAASYAIRHHGLARWRARPDNRGSSGAAQRLGFEPWCTQLAIR